MLDTEENHFYTNQLLIHSMAVEALPPVHNYYRDSLSRQKPAQKELHHTKTLQLIMESTKQR